MTLHQIVAGDPKAYGTFDLWSFDLLEVGRPLPCNSLRTFLHYLCSRGTREASIAPYIIYTNTDTSSSPAVDVVLSGPRADDGEVLSISYRLRREEIHGDGVVHEGLEVWEKRLLVERIMALSPPIHNNPWRLAIRAFAGVMELPYAA
jgi:hypothetical protein